MFQKWSQKQIWAPKTGVRKEKGVKKVVTQGKMGPKHGQGNINVFQIRSHKQNEVSNMVTEISHSFW